MKFVGRKEAARGNSALDKVLRDIEGWMTACETSLGFAPTGAQQTSPTDRVAAPKPPLLDVDGSADHFHISITQRQNLPSTQQFEVQYSSTLPFETSTDVTSVEVSGDSVIDIYDPSSVKYFRARARLTNSPWSAWVYTSAVFSSGAGDTSVKGLTGASVVTLFSGATKAAGAVVVGDTLLGMGGESVSVTAIFTFGAQAPMRLTSTNSGPADLGTDLEVIQLDGNFKRVGDVQVGDSVLTRVAGENIGDTITAATVQPAEVLVSLILSGSKTLLVNNIWCRMKV